MIGRITCVGLRDPFWEEGLIPSDCPGPVLSWLKDLPRDSPVVLIATAGTKANSFATRQALLDRNPQSHVEVLETDCTDPTDLEALIPLLDKCWQRAQKVFPKIKQWKICVSPGTPQMQMAWILLCTAGRIDGTLERLRRDPKTGQSKAHPLRVTSFRDLLQKKPTKLRSSGKEKKPLPPSLQAFIGESAEAKKLVESIERVAHYSTSVLLQGESGTGKELLARMLHFSSPRASNPFIAINCASLNAELLESELFGAAKGAFTGAVIAREGIVTQADSGTLFLDEISEMSLSVQPKLLRFLETGEYSPLGDSKNYYADVRIVAAANACLEKRIRNGHFRRDLYHRVCGVCINIPPLRERQGDTHLLIKHYLSNFNIQYGKRKHFTAEALRVLLRYDWPGNVRELHHAIQEAFILSTENEISLIDIPARVRGKLHLSVDVQLSENEHEAYEKALNEATSMAQAAKRLGIAPHTFRKRLRARFPELMNKFRSRQRKQLITKGSSQ